jgi:murein DD-endopeptidase MepM/ murein hydrolase activator NlpD
MVENASRLFVTLDKVEVIDEGGRTLFSLEGAALQAMIEPFGNNAGKIAPGGSAAVFLDASVGPGETTPASLAIRIGATRESARPDGKPAPLPADAPVPATFAFTTATTTIGAPAVVVAPPLEGKGWVVANGCCDSITSHRGAIMAVNGGLRVPERFAIDWVQLGEDGKIFTGAGTALEDFRYYGAPVHAAADGIVVNLYDEADAQTPGQITGITPANIGGNMIVVDIGAGNFAFYAHLQRGSLKVKLGDRVKTGDVIALLGNTGNTDAPHLHFHVMDDPSPLDANGLPFVFTRFSSPGTLAAGSVDDLVAGKPVSIDATRLSGEHVKELPLNNQVVDFD